MIETVVLGRAWPGEPRYEKGDPNSEGTGGLCSGHPEVGGSGSRYVSLRTQANFVNLIFPRYMYITYVLFTGTDTGLPSRVKAAHRRFLR